mmetsp:Transcript_15110/g.46968  ORF Transcript_15110/g.46968 Transcript_15110/m.46968 type:complete len:397 (-) Transcript_15110:33-1223(-)
MPRFHVANPKTQRLQLPRGGRPARLGAEHRAHGAGAGQGLLGGVVFFFTRAVRPAAPHAVVRQRSRAVEFRGRLSPSGALSNVRVRLEGGGAGGVETGPDGGRSSARGAIGGPELEATDGLDREPARVGRAPRALYENGRRALGLARRLGRDGRRRRRLVRGLGGARTSSRNLALRERPRGAVARVVGQPGELTGIAAAAQRAGRRGPAGARPAPAPRDAGPRRQRAMRHDAPGARPAPAPRVPEPRRQQTERSAAAGGRVALETRGAASGQKRLPRPVAGGVRLPVASRKLQPVAQPLRRSPAGDVRAAEGVEGVISRAQPVRRAPRLPGGALSRPRAAGRRRRRRGRRRRFSRALRQRQLVRRRGPPRATRGRPQRVLRAAERSRGRGRGQGRR